MGNKASLQGMLQAGYMYGIIGWTGVPDFYRKIVGATVIENTDPPGSYRGLLGRGHLFE